jgi:NADH:ubiquinone oxidoreductase subunit H
MEYSAISFAVFFLAEYNHILLMSVLFTILFLGGWDFIDFSIIEKLVYCFLNNFSFGLVETIRIKINLFFFKQLLLQKFINFFGIKTVTFFFFLKIYFETFILIVKSFCIASLFVIIRASVPRYKFVQLISICWEVFIPVLLLLFFFCLLITVLFIF